MNEQDIVNEAEGLEQLLFDENAFNDMIALLVCEIEDLNLQLEQQSNAPRADKQRIVDTHYTMVVKTKTLHLIREISNGLHQ